MTWRTPWRLAELNNLFSALNIYDGAIAYGTYCKRRGQCRALGRYQLGQEDADLPSGVKVRSLRDSVNGIDEEVPT